MRSILLFIISKKKKKKISWYDPCITRFKFLQPINHWLLLQARNFQAHSHIWKKRGICQGWNAECALEKIWSVCVLTGGQRGVWQQTVVWPEQQLQASMEQIIDLDKYQVDGCTLECGFRVITLKKKKKNWTWRCSLAELLGIWLLA